MVVIAVGQILRKKRILDVVHLSNGWYVIKTEDGKSSKDFRVKTILRTFPRIKSITPKHAHFVIDFYGKLCADRQKGLETLDAILAVWQHKPVKNVIDEYQSRLSGQPGYEIEYILYALNWILDQEDINYWGRPEAKQREIDEVFRKSGVSPPSDRPGSMLAVSLFCNVAQGLHPVEAFIRANLDVIPVKRARGAV